MPSARRNPAPTLPMKATTMFTRRSLLALRSRPRNPVSHSPLFGAAFLRSVEPPAMSLDMHEVKDEESGKRTRQRRP